MVYITMNIVPRKTSIFTWPNNLTKSQAQKFFLGYFYGDGCFHRYPNRDVIHLVTTQQFAQGLREKGKAPKVVITAVMHKMLRVIYGMLKKGVLYEEVEKKVLA